MNRALVAALFGLTACASGEARPGGAPADAAVIEEPHDSRITTGPDASTIAVDAAPQTVDASSTATGCSAATSCQGATSLGTISGDTNADVVSADGYQSAWYRVRVTEDDSDVYGLTLIAGATLTVPAGADFNVFMYLNEGADVVECATSSGTTATSGNQKSVYVEWGEGFFSNGDDDSRDVTVEVRAAGTTCSAADSWHLDVWGN